MKFCLIPHFFIGLYMYTNSSILTPWKFGEEIYAKVINTKSQYLNSQRFSNIHTVIFLSGIAFFIALFILRYTFFWLLGKLAGSCKDFRDKFIP